MSKHYAIKCTNCASPLDILGGGRVNTVTCSYCHSVLDMNDHYKVLAKFNNTVHPDGPFKIGMRGNIKGVEWTIIGWVHYKTGEFPSEEWDEFFLYSPTHGYAWLVYEEKTLSFSKRIRDFDLYTWKEEQPKSLFYHKGHYLQKESSYLTYIQYVEGELNWVAKFGDTFTTWDYNGVKYQSLSVEQGKKELEVYHTERLNKADIYSAFKLEYTPKSKSHTDTSENEKIYENIIEDTPSYDMWKILLFLLIGTILFSFFNTKTLTSFYVNENNMTHTFTIDSSAFLTEIDIDSPIGLKDSKLSLFHDNKKVFYIDQNTVYFINKDLSHNWSHTSIHTNIYLKLDKGNYTFQFQRSNEYQHNISITIKEKVIRLKYILPLFIIIFFILLFYLYRHYFGWKLIAIPILLLIVVFGYTYIAGEFIFGLVLFLLYIYGSITGRITDDSWDFDDD